MRNSDGQVHEMKKIEPLKADMGEEGVSWLARASIKKNPPFL